MVDTIGPMVRASEKRGRGVEIAHALGGLSGGAVTGFAVGAVGAVVGLDDKRPGWVAAAAAVFAIVAIIVDAVHEGKKLGLGRQTSRAWRHVLPARAAAFFNGFDLGLGWTTRIYFTSFLVSVMAALVSAHALAGAAIGASFGAARALFVVLAQRRYDGTLAIDSIAAQRGRVVALNAIGLLQFAVVAVAAAASGL